MSISVPQVVTPPTPFSGKRVTEKGSGRLGLIIWITLPHRGLKASRAKARFPGCFTHYLIINILRVKHKVYLIINILCVSPEDLPSAISI